jgi:hypothetical protein
VVVARRQTHNRHEITISGDRLAILVIPIPLTPAEKAQLKAFIDLILEPEPKEEENDDTTKTDIEK